MCVCVCYVVLVAGNAFWNAQILFNQYANYFDWDSKTEWFAFYLHDFILLLSLSLTHHFEANFCCCCHFFFKYVMHIYFCRCVCVCVNYIFSIILSADYPSIGLLTNFEMCTIFSVSFRFLPPILSNRIVCEYVMRNCFLFICCCYFCSIFHLFVHLRCVADFKAEYPLSNIDYKIISVEHKFNKIQCIFIQSVCREYKSVTLHPKMQWTMSLFGKIVFGMEKKHKQFYTKSRYLWLYFEVQLQVILFSCTSHNHLPCYYSVLLTIKMFASQAHSTITEWSDYDPLDL